MKLKQVPFRLELKTVQQVVLSELWSRYPSVRAAGLDLEVPEYLLHIWRARGKVPVKEVLSLSKKLKVSPFALNYLGWSVVVGSDETWAQAVKSCKFEPEVEAKILKAKPPKEKRK